MLTWAECLANGGEWDGSPSCDPNPCVPQDTAVCCHGFFCIDWDPNDEAGCLATYGVFIPGTTCAANPCNCPDGTMRGDSNCDTLGPNSYDIDGFILAVGLPAQWVATYSCDLYCANDINCDGDVNSYDIDWFIICVGSGVCPPCP